MNVLFLSEQIYPHGSGAELATYLYADLLSKSDFNVRVVTNKFAGEPAFSTEGHLEIYRLPLFKNSESVKYSMLERIDVLFSSFLRKMLKWADVVYVPRFWFSAIPLAKAYGKSVVTHLHDYIPICPLSTTFDASKKNLCKGNNFICPPKCVYSFEKTGSRSFKDALASIAFNSAFGSSFPRLIKLSDAVICVSKAQRDILSKADPSFSSKLSVVYNPLPGFEDVPLKGDDFGYFGGLNYLKGFQTLNTAAARIIGLSSKPLKIRSTKISNIRKEFADALGRSGFLLYGKVERKQYNEIYANIQAVLVPSLWPEPWPYVVVEALMQGRLVIASHVGGIPEQTEGCKGVFLCESGDAVDLAKNMLSVTNFKKEKIVSLGLQNRDAFFKKFGDECNAKKFIGIIENSPDRIVTKCVNLVNN
jgi:glycosyltransferase involved in cell wall biosynthesis